MDDIKLSIDVLVCLFSFEAILHGLRALSQGHGVYFCLVLVLLMAALDVHINILSNEELHNFHIDIRS